MAEMIGQERGSTITYTGRQVLEICCNCAIAFTIPEDFRRRRLLDQKPFYCPNGHGQSYTGKTEVQKLKEELEVQKRTKEVYIEKSKALERRVAAQKGIHTKLKKRVANGVCPCCNRSFENLHQHIKNQHPDFVEKK